MISRDAFWLMNARRAGFNIVCLFISVLLPPLAQAQFNYTTNQGVVTIVGYTGTNGTVAIPSTIAGLPVTTIASYAFYLKTTLTNLTIPDSVTNIASYAFYNCTRMTNMTLGTNISTIGMAAFQGCSGLTDVVLPDSVTSMGTGAFTSCTHLNRITLGSNLTALGSSVFADCSSLNRISLGSNLTAIGTSAFADCSSLTNITIPSGVKSIGSQAFYGCLSLLNVVVPDAVTNVGSRAFSSCVNLRSVALGTNVSIIGSYAFQSCSNLTKIGLPDSVTTLGDYALSLCPSLADISIGTNTGSIGNYAFQGCISLVQLTIPASVTNIGAYVFANCPNLTEIAVASNNPAYVSLAGVLLNRSQTTLIQYPVGNAAQTYAIPNTVTNIADGAFKGCIALVSLTIPEGVTRIPNNVFSGCSGLTSVNIPNSIRYIPSAAFYGCSNLFSITIPNSVTNIGNAAFQGCTSLTSVTIPDRVNYLGSSAFLACSSLTNATIGNSVTNIQASAFSGCSSLTRVSLGYIVYTIGDQAFHDCSSLAAIYFYGAFPYNVFTNAFTNAPATAYYLPGATRWATNLAGLPTVVWVPFTYATNNGEIIITGCTDRFLSAITISNTITELPVTGIGDHAFDQCTRLVSITIPDSVNHLGSHALAGCTNLVDIYFDGNTPTADLPVFGASPKATVYYRPGTSGWSSTFNGLPTALWIKFDPCVHDGVVEIGPYTDSVSDVIIPRTIHGLPVTGIGLDAFRWSSITSVSIPDSVTYITTGAFDACGQLSSVRLSHSISVIGWWQFTYCGSLTNITIPASVNTLINYAFYNSGLRTIYFEGNAPALDTAGANPRYFFGGTSATAYYLPGTSGWTDFLSQVGIPGQLWDPRIQTGDGSFGVRTNQFGFNITGTSNLAIVVQTCADLSNPVWTPLQTNTLTGALLYFGDPHWMNYGSRFYRLRWP
jgi:hypothetical protein